VKTNLLEALAPQPDIDGSAVRFTLVAVRLPGEVTDNMSWELCYETEPTSELYFAVQMRGWVLENVSVEC
jgi:hypothetical protein